MKIDDIKNGYFVYKVKQNDSIKSIAKKTNLNHFELKQFNANIDNLNIDDIIYYEKSSLSSYVVRPADTLNSICKTQNVTAEQLNKCNKSLLLYVGKKIYLPGFDDNTK